MSNALEIDGKTLHPIKDAAQLVSYSRDYVTRLAREEKIIAQLVGRQWFVDVDSLQRYAEASAMEQELRKKRLSDERKRERELRDVLEEEGTLRLGQADQSHSHAVSVAALVLCLGLVTGWGALSLFNFSTPSATSLNTAQVKTSVVSPTAPALSAPVTDEPAGLLPEYSSRTIGDLPNDKGILLLPTATGTTPAELFSDEVVVLEDESGVTRVQRVDSEGNPVGNDIPFVTVPINQSTN